MAYFRETFKFRFIFIELNKNQFLLENTDINWPSQEMKFIITGLSKVFPFVSLPTDMFTFLSLNLSLCSLTF